jgi:hypothetical protein
VVDAQLRLAVLEKLLEKELVLNLFVVVTLDIFC